MKYYLITLLILFAYSYGYCQYDIQKGNYRFTENELGKFSPQFDSTSFFKGKKKSVEIKKDFLISVWKYSPKEDLVYYKYLDFHDSTSSSSTYVDTIKKKGETTLVTKEYNIKVRNPNSELYDSKIFVMDAASFMRLTEPIYSRYKGVQVGVYTVPFRLRDIGGENFDFESSLSLQANMILGLGRRKNPFSTFDLSGGIGLTSVTLNAKNSNLLEVDGNRSASALTISFGGVFKPSQYANIGVFLGWDFLGAKDRETQWVFNKKTWLGVGINVSFNALNQNKPSTKQTKQ